MVAFLIGPLADFLDTIGGKLSMCGKLVVTGMAGAGISGIQRPSASTEFLDSLKPWDDDSSTSLPPSMSEALRLAAPINTHRAPVCHILFLLGKLPMQAAAGVLSHRHSASSLSRKPDCRVTRGAGSSWEVRASPGASRVSTLRRSFGKGLPSPNFVGISGLGSSCYSRGLLH